MAFFHLELGWYFYTSLVFANFSSLPLIGCPLSSKMVDVGFTLSALMSLNFLKKFSCQFLFKLSSISFITVCSHFLQSSITAFLTAFLRVRYSICLPASVLRSCHCLQTFLFASMIKFALCSRQLISSVSFSSALGVPHTHPTPL